MAVELTMDARSDDLETYVTVEFSDGVWATIIVSIRATDRIGADIKEKILDILDGTKPWYSPFAGDIRPILIGLFVYVLLSYIRLNPTSGEMEGSLNRNPSLPRPWISQFIRYSYFTLYCCPKNKQALVLDLP